MMSFMQSLKIIIIKTRQKPEKCLFYDIKPTKYTI